MGMIVIFCIFFLWFLLPAISHAESQGIHVTYVGVITEDEEDGKIFFPSAVFVDQVMKEIYVVDSKARIIIYTSDFFPLFTIDRRRGIESPSSVAVDSDGNVYITQSKSKENPRHRISVLNACLKWQRDIYLEGFKGAETIAPYRIAIDKKGNIYVTGSSYTGVIILDNQGKLQEIISPEEDGRDVSLTYVTLDSKGRMYLLSEIESRIYVYDENRKFLFKFGEKGGSTAKLSRPVAMAIDNMRERIYVVDYMRHSVSAYSTKDGDYLFEFGGLGWGEGWFQHPRDIAVDDSTGRIFVADTFNDRIEVFKPKD